MRFSAFAACSLVTQVTTVCAGIFIGMPVISVWMVVCHRPGLARLPAKRGRASVETTANSARLRSFIRILRWFSEEHTSELFHAARTGGGLDTQRSGERGGLVAALHHHHEGTGRRRSIDLERGT